MEDVDRPGDVALASVPPRRWRWPKRVLAALGLIGLLLALGVLVLNSPAGHRFVADQIARVAPASGLRIQVGRIDGSLYGEAVLHDVTFSDPQGPFLRVPRLELDWRPFSWFARGLDVRRLIARRGVLLRAPDLLPGDPDAPILPDFDIRVERLQFDNLTIARGILGEPRRVDLLGRADIRDGRVFARVDSRLGGTDRLFALVDAEPDRDRFDLSLDYMAPRGGLLAQLAGAKEGMQARIAGDGTWTRWRGALLVRQGKRRLAALRLTNDDGTYGILGKVDPADYLGDGLLGRPVAVMARGTLRDSVLAGTVGLASDALRLGGGGRIDLAGNRFERFVLRANRLHPALFGNGVGLDDVRLDATLDGPFRALAVTHDLSVGVLDMSGTKMHGLRQKGVLTRLGQNWTLPLDLIAARVETGNATVDPRLKDGRLRGSVILAGNRLASDNLRIVFPGLAAQLALRGDLARGGYALAGPVAARGLLLENLGAVDADAGILLKMGQGVPWLLRANLAGRMPRVTNATLTGLAGTDIRFRGAVVIGGQQPLLFRDAALTASKLALWLDGKVEGGRTTLAGRGRHADYGQFTIDAALADDGPRAELVFASPLPAAGLHNVRVALAPISQGFHIDTRGASMLGPFDGELDLFSPPGGPTRIEIRRLTVTDSNVAGTLVLGDGGATGTLAVAGGGLDGTIRLAPRGGGQGFEIALAAKNAGFAGATPTTIATARIDAQGVIGGGRTEVVGSLFARGITHGELFLGQVAARADIVNGRGSFNASLAGERGSRFTLQIGGGFEPDRIAVAAQGQLAGRAISMPRRAILSREGEAWRLEPSQLTFGKGIAIAQGRFGGARPNELNLKLAGMPLSLIDVVGSDLGLGGTLSGIIDYREGPGGVPIGEARLKAMGLSRSGLTLSSRPIDLLLVARLDPDQLRTRAVIREGGASRGRVQARISRLPSTGGLGERLTAGDLFAQLQFQGPVEALWRLTTIELFDVTGDFNVVASVNGTLLQPIVQGAMRGEGLRLTSPITGTDIRKLSVRGAFSGSRLSFSRLAGEARNGGKVTASGTVDLANLAGRGPEIDLKIAARDALLLNRRDMSAVVTGPMRIVSDGIGGTLAGRLDIREANWRLGRASSARALPDIATREINLPPDIAPRRQRGQPWRYLIDAGGNNRIFVRGMGLDSEWRGKIRLRGTTADPRIGGEASLVEGIYDFAGTRFELDRGRIGFDESSAPDPRLDILATTKSDGLEVRVTVKGSAMQPEIAFSSTPALPEEEIMARLLFGGSITELSATDALQLGTAIASLRGGGGIDPINRLRKAIGLDRLRIVTADAALGRETGVALGKNISRRVYVEIITDGRGYSATELEFRVTNWLSLLGAVSTIGRESVAAEVSKDY